MEINSLPDELLCQILIKLAPKSLLQIMCVCKSWHSLINTSEFISLHLSHSHNPKVLLRRFMLSNLTETYSLHNDDHNFDEIQSLYFPFKSKFGCFIVLGCVNGLVCIWDFLSGIVLLWNPCIRKCYTLPDSCETKCSVGRVFGFGYDALTDDYKVVRRIAVASGDNEHSWGCAKPDECSSSVFSLRERCWRKTGFVPNWNTCSRPCTVGGEIHRVTSVDDNKMKIISFNLSSETCSEFACPEGIYNVLPSIRVELSIFRESLALMHTSDEFKTHIWVLREVGVVKSWSKLFSLDLGPLLSCGNFLAGFSKNGFVLTAGGHGAVVEPIVENPTVVNLQISDRGEYHWHVESYKESLVLLAEGDDVTLSIQNNADDNKGGEEEAPVIIVID